MCKWAHLSLETGLKALAAEAATRTTSPVTIGEVRKRMPENKDLWGAERLPVCLLPAPLPSPCLPSCMLASLSVYLCVWSLRALKPVKSIQGSSTLIFHLPEPIVYLSCTCAYHIGCHSQNTILYLISYLGWKMVKANFFVLYQCLYRIFKVVVFFPQEMLVSTGSLNSISEKTPLVFRQQSLHSCKVIYFSTNW